jgi:hypothetical protein
MSTKQPEMSVERWLDSLERALAPLPAADKRNILAEAREHLHERVSTGVPPAEALAGFGSADDYARAFKEDDLLTRARATRRLASMLGTVIRFSRRSSVAAIALVFATALGFCGFWSVFCIAVKAVHPELVGLWLDFPLSTPHRYEHSQPDFIPLGFGHDHILFGFQDPPPAFPEYLGAWIYPCLAVIALLSYLGLRAVLRAAILRIRSPLASAGAVTS